MATDVILKAWPEWKVEKTLGKGSYGTVYKAVRNDNNIQSKAAIKVVSIPLDRSELESLRSEGLTEEDSKTYFRGIVNDFVSEISMMESLKGTQNIVSVEDYKVIERENEIGWDIYIRMELLTPFNTYLCDKKMTEQEVIKLGIDICSALEICEKRNIVHRDIKPENIFINDFGHFKLGDFGIARTLENSTGGLSQKGTFNYMAPEIATGKNYDARVDIYSLGIVLYRLLNGNRLPFIEDEKQLLSPSARKLAVDRRMRGDQMLPPCFASKPAADVIMRACAYSPDVRFASATVMKKALQQVESGSYEIDEVDLDKTVSVRRATPEQNTNATPNVQGWNRVTPSGQSNTPVLPVQPAKTVQQVRPPVQPVKPPVQQVRQQVKPATPPNPPIKIDKRPLSWLSLWGIIAGIACLGNTYNGRFLLGVVAVAIAVFFTLIGKIWLRKTKPYNIPISILSLCICIVGIIWSSQQLLLEKGYDDYVGALIGAAISVVYLILYLVLGNQKK